jgi:hypothetical protein
MRRKFMEAKKAQGKNSKVGKADWALNHIQKLYRIETHWTSQLSLDSLLFQKIRFFEFSR